MPGRLASQASRCSSPERRTRQSRLPGTYTNATSILLSRRGYMVRPPRVARWATVSSPARSTRNTASSPRGASYLRPRSHPDSSICRRSAYASPRVRVSTAVRGSPPRTVLSPGASASVGLSRPDPLSRSIPRSNPSTAKVCAHGSHPIPESRRKAEIKTIIPNDPWYLPPEAHPPRLRRNAQAGPERRPGTSGRIVMTTVPKPALDRWW